MRFQSLCASVVIAAALTISAAFGDTARAPNYTQVHVTHPPDDLGACYADEAQLSADSDDPKIELTIAADGTLEKFVLPEGSPDWMEELADCALARFRFSPASLDGVPVKGSISLRIRLRAHRSGQSAGVAIEGIGPIVTPPRMWRTGGSTDACYRKGSWRAADINHFIVDLTVRRDGSVADVKLQICILSWHDKLTRCVLARIAFSPGTRDGSPVDAAVQLPIVRQGSPGKVNAPELRSTEEEIEAAYRTCYPPDQFAIGSAAYSFIIATNGRVSDPVIVKSTGDPLFDETGACILKLLEFTPLKQNGRRIRTKGTWVLPIRPPR